MQKVPILIMTRNGRYDELVLFAGSGLVQARGHLTLEANNETRQS